ncbi:MAG: hypothetical protein DMG06_21340 [Acidobacteria bacterium]|nr:MAG: hypothetical protein DMG06_21340 [Acidobacteriota bacterium]
MPLNFPREPRNRLTETALRAAQAAGRVLMKFFLGKAENFREFKGRNDLVTSADLESCRIIKKHLKRSFPNHSFLFEEQEYSESNGSDYLWIVDPLDGTTFHNRGLPFFSVIIALQIRNRIELSLSYCPFTSDLFMSRRGKGSFQSNNRFHLYKRLQVSKTKQLEEAIIGYSYGKTESQSEQISQILTRLLPSCRALTRIAGSDIGYVASGACDAFLDNSSTPWDFAAAALMVREAGGKVTDFAGQEWDSGSKTILASNKILHSQILNIINTSNRDSSQNSRTS